MSLVVEHPQLPAPAALSDLSSPAVDEREPEVVATAAAEDAPTFCPPSELLLAAASLALWVGMALAVRHLRSRRLART